MNRTASRKPMSIATPMSGPRDGPEAADQAVGKRVDAEHHVEELWLHIRGEVCVERSAYAGDRAGDARQPECGITTVFTTLHLRQQIIRAEHSEHGTETRALDQPASAISTSARSPKMRSRNSIEADVAFEHPANVVKTAGAVRVRPFLRRSSTCTSTIRRIQAQHFREGQGRDRKIEPAQPEGQRTDQRMAMIPATQRCRSGFPSRSAARNIAVAAPAA